MVFEVNMIVVYSVRGWREAGGQSPKWGFFSWPRYRFWEHISFMRTNRAWHLQFYPFFCVFNAYSCFFGFKSLLISLCPLLCNFVINLVLLQWKWISHVIWFGQKNDEEARVCWVLICASTGLIFLCVCDCILLDLLRMVGLAHSSQERAWAKATSWSKYYLKLCSEVSTEECISKAAWVSHSLPTHRHTG